MVRAIQRRNPQDVQLTEQGKRDEIRRTTQVDGRPLYVERVQDCRSQGTSDVGLAATAFSSVTEIVVTLSATEGKNEGVMSITTTVMGTLSYSTVEGVTGVR